MTARAGRGAVARVQEYLREIKTCPGFYPNFQLNLIERKIKI
jgi:hypothetical protein